MSERPEQPELTQFVGTNESDLLRHVADWLGEEPTRILIGLWSTGFGEPWEVCLQVITTVGGDESDGPP